MARASGPLQSVPIRGRHRSQGLAESHPHRIAARARGSHQGRSRGMTTTHMVQITLDARKLTKWAIDRRIDAGDLGYTCHALLCDAVGGLRPKPFAAEEKMGR